jgi:hypothetical protein
MQTPDLTLDNVRPEYLRLPKSGTRCRWTGLSRSALYELILSPRAPVKSVVLKRRGAKRGVRLIHLPSLIAYLHAQTPPDVPPTGLPSEFQPLDQTYVTTSFPTSTQTMNSRHLTPPAMQVSTFAPDSFTMGGSAAADTHPLADQLMSHFRSVQHSDLRAFAPNPLLTE